MGNWVSCSGVKPRMKGPIVNLVTTLHVPYAYNYMENKPIVILGFGLLSSPAFHVKELG